MTTPKKPFKPFRTPMEDWDVRLKRLERERERMEPGMLETPARVTFLRGAARVANQDQAYQRDQKGHERFTLFLGTPAR